MIKRGQITIFIIIAIILVAGVALFFTVRKQSPVTSVDKNLEPAYQTFLDCLEQDAQNGVDILGTQGGYIYPPKFEPGSSYMPFSSQLEFMGSGIPYWYYVSGNNVAKEQVPSKEKMEQDLGQFISEKIKDCNFDDYYREGFQIDLNPEDLKATASINDNTIDVSLKAQLSITDGESATIVRDHKIQINSRLGKFYKTARQIYDKEQKDMFLENYGIDDIRLYAPVDGVELSCAPKTWVAQDVVKDLQNAIEANTLALKTKGNYYTVGKNNKYFIIDLPTDESVNFLNSKNWPYKVEISPVEGDVLIAQPVGNQPGLGILGFCYIPYHFVYDVSYPVLVQIYNNDEVFQFPLAVVIKGNKPREALKDAQAVDIGLPELCTYKNTSVKVNVYDNSLRPIDADVSFECFGTRCDIGKTLQGELIANYPACVNGFIRAKADGYVDGKYQYSTNKAGEVSIVLDKKYDIDVTLKKNNLFTNESAIVSFVSDKNSVTISYPEQKIVSLSEGQYNVSVYSYSSASINLQEQIQKQCVDIPNTGVLGLFGGTTKKCFDIKIPAQIVTQALAGGGNQNYYIAESELQKSGNVEINYGGFSTPMKIEDLQTNYEVVQIQGLDITFK